MNFSHFPKVLLHHVRCPLIYFRSFMDHVTIFSTSHMHYLKMELFWQKIGNSWKLLLIAVTESFILNVMRLLDPILKHKDKFRLQSDSLSPSKKNCDIFFNESPLKMITNAFYFIFISFSGYLIFFLTFWPSRKNGLIRNIKLISKFMISQPG